MLVYQKTIKLRFIVEKKNWYYTKTVRFLTKHDYRTQIYHEKKNPMIQWVKRFGAMEKNYGTLIYYGKTMVPYQKLLYYRKL